jgi:flagellar biosynthesis/type III secretory pathway ATPase
MLMPVPDTAFLREAQRGLAAWRPFEVTGRVRSVVGLLVEVEGIRPSLGAFCLIESEGMTGALEGEVVGLRDATSLVMPFGELRGIKVGARVRIQADVDRVPTGSGCLGRVLDALGRPIDGKGPLVDVGWRPIEGAPIGTVTRARIAEPLDLGLRALNVFATVGRGMRLGIFAGSGVGKSTLLGQLASQADVDVSVRSGSSSSGISATRSPARSWSSPPATSRRRSERGARGSRRRSPKAIGMRDATSC